MPKIAKDKLIENTNLDTKITSKKSTTEKVSKTVKSATTASNKSEKKATASEKTEKKVATSKTSSKSKVASTSVAKKSSKKSASTKKSTVTSSKVAKKSSTRAKSSSKKKQISEYYDLPNSYNQTIVKILAQTPTILFVYWDLSIEDGQNFINNYGEDFFNNTIPYLIVRNLTKNYSFEVEINDYANSWYVNIPDSDCKYDVTLVRKSKYNDGINLNNNYITITSSNDLQTPNDRILFDSLGRNIFFKDVSNNSVEVKDISSLSFMKNIGKIYNVYDLYKEIYKNELNDNKLAEGLSSSNISF